MPRVPNFLHLGPGKSGSTWLHETLIHHPDVWLSEAKDLYYFSRYPDRGRDWYLGHFAAAGDQPVVGEVCPDYLAAPDAARLVRDDLGPDVRLMVSLRDPVDRAFSSFLYATKHGLAAPTLRAEVERDPRLVEEGRYGTQLRRFAAQFPLGQVHVAVFDDLEADPRGYLDSVTDWLDLPSQDVTPEMLEATLPASKARFVPLARATKAAADWVRARDGAAMIGRVKRSPWVQQTLYRPLGVDRPRIDPADETWLREVFDKEIALVEDDFGIALRERWGWR